MTRLPQTRQESIAYYRRLSERAEQEKISPEEIERDLAQNDLFYLLTVVLNRRDCNRDWIFDRCREVQANPNGYLDLWAREHFKDLADDTHILTANRGWIRHGGIEVGDLVYDDGGDPVRVLAVSGPYTTSECYKLTFSDGEEIVAGAGHLWNIRSKHRPRNGAARRVEWSTEILPTHKLAIGDDVGVLLAPIYGTGTFLPVDPYILGVWLGDGSTRSTRITSGLDDADEMEALLRSRGVTVTRATHSNAVSLRIGSGRRGDRTSSDFADGLREIGVYEDKHIPALYREAGIMDRMALLRGLMDSDGTCNDRGTATFVSANPALAFNVFELANGLALRARRRAYMTADGALYWQISFQAHRDRNPFLMARKAARAIPASPHRNCRTVTSIERVASVPTRCIQVEGGTYVVGPRLVPTHNSTIITFALTIQEVINDPEITVGIFSFNSPTATAFLRQIKMEFEGNEKLRELFPEIFWENAERQSPKWSERDGIIVKRKGNPKESTIEAWGLVDGQPTSKHFRLMVYDDVVTGDSVTSPEMIEKVTRAWETSLNLTTIGGNIRYIGTRWHYADTYRTILSRGAAVERRHAVTDDGTVTGNPVLWDKATVAQKRRDMGPYTFSSQMLLDPAADRTQGFKEDWIRFYIPNRDGDFSNMNKYLLVDAASEKKRGSDYTAMVVIGLGEDENLYLLDAIRDRLSLTERAAAVFSLSRRWRPMSVGYERYGLMADVEYIKERQREENYRFEVIELGGKIGKLDRIRRMIPIFESGRFHLPESMIKVDYEGKHVDLVQAFLNDEYRPFPVAIHDDMFDALSRIQDPEIRLIWPKSPVKEDRYARARVRPRARSSWAA